MCILSYCFHRITRVCFSINFYLVVKSHRGVCSELSALYCVYYHAICIEVFGYVVLTTFFPLVINFPWCLYISYQIFYVYIIMLFTPKLPDVYFPTTFFSWVNSYRDVCMWVINSDVHVLSFYLHRSLLGACFLIKKFGVKKNLP